MTDIDNVPAGSDLDRLIAEKVMGWEMTPALGGNGFMYQFWHLRGVKLCTIHDWSPSTDIADAWEVVEKMTANLKGDYSFVIHTDGRTSECGWFYSSEGFTDEAPGFTKADTAPLAICRAALKAVAS